MGRRRRANDHPAPYHVKYWQLGNEISGDDEAYIKKCREFIRVMKRADSTIAILSSFPSQKVLDVLGHDLAYLAPHHYTRDLAACEADFANLSRMIARTPGCGHLRLAVTEWNFTAGDWGLGRGKMLTLEGALWNARYLNLLCRHSNIAEIACRSNMTNSFCSGIIGTRPGGLLKRPSYHVMKLYADHALPIPLATGPAPAGLDVIACADEPRQAVCVFAVNTRTEPVSLSLDLAGLGSGLTPLSTRVGPRHARPAATRRDEPLVGPGPRRDGRPEMSPVPLSRFPHSRQRPLSAAARRIEAEVRWLRPGPNHAIAFFAPLDGVAGVGGPFCPIDDELVLVPPFGK